MRPKMGPDAVSVMAENFQSTDSAFETKGADQATRCNAPYTIPATVKPMNKVGLRIMTFFSSA